MLRELNWRVGGWAVEWARGLGKAQLRNRGTCTPLKKKKSSLYTLSSPLWEAPVSPQLLTWLGCACLPQSNTALHTTDFQARYVLHLKKAAPDAGLGVDSSSGPEPSGPPQTPLASRRHQNTRAHSCPSAQDVVAFHQLADVAMRKTIVGF